MNEQTEKPRVRIVSWKEAEELVGRPRSTIKHMCANGFFPQPVQVSAVITGFLSDEVESWLQDIRGRRVHYNRPGNWKNRPKAVNHQSPALV